MKHIIAAMALGASVATGGSNAAEDEKWDKTFGTKNENISISTGSSHSSDS